MFAAGYPAAGRSQLRGYDREADDVRLLVVRCGPYRLGVPMGLVRAVVGASEIVPLGLPDLPGLVWRDGILMPAVGLSPLLGLPEGDNLVSGHGVLVEAGAGPLCFMVDEAMDFKEVAPSGVVPLPSLVVRRIGLSGLESAALDGGLLLIVDPVLMLGQRRAAELVAAAVSVGESGSQRGRAG